MLSLIVNPIHVCETRVQCRNRTGQAFHSVTLWSFILTLDVLSNRFILWWNWKKIFKSPPNAECHFSSLHLLQNVAQAILIEKPNIILAIYIIGKKKIICTNFTLICLIRNIRSFWYNCELVIQHVNFMRCFIIWLKQNVWLI